MQMSVDHKMKLFLKVWRQVNAKSEGRLVDYTLEGISEHMSFLEMIDVLNQRLIHEGQDPVAFDHDCREGICGTCSLTINGAPHGPDGAITVCQLHMRRFKDGDTIVIEPFRARAFPIIRDLVVDRSSMDRVIAAGGYTSINVGSAAEANSMLIGKEDADQAFDAAACIGCGACVAACKNASAMLFVGAKVTQFTHLPQGQPERSRRVINMVLAMDHEGFGSCSNTGACEAVCPKGIKLDVIKTLNSELGRAMCKGSKKSAAPAGGF
jgi:succinate dehydrogenase / fumarate reductase iron-sulfur subunit